MRARQVLAGVVLLATSVVAAPAAATVEASDLPDRAAASGRLSGEDRFATAAAVATAAFDSADTVVLARGDLFPDALTGSYLAGLIDAPILLSEPGALSEAAAGAIDELGASEVVLLGGPAALGPAVEEALVGDGLSVSRVQGEDRFATAAAIADATPESTDIGSAPNADGDLRRTALLATGLNFPDAIAAGPLAAGGTHPVLLTATDRVPDATLDALDAVDAEQVVVLGGGAAVDEDVVATLEAEGYEVLRVSGPDRFATAAAIADLTAAVLGTDGEEVLVATGRDFPDALALSAYADTRSATLVLADTDALTAPAFGHLDRACGTTTQVTAAGGAAALSDTVLGQAALATSCADGVFPLDGELEVGSEGDDDGTGLARLYVDPDDSSVLCMQLEVDGIEPATAAHVHAGVFDAAGPVVAALPTPDGSGFAADCLDEVVEGSVAELRDQVLATPNAFYVNVHNAEHPAGAVRANMVHDAERTLSGFLEIDADDGSMGAGDADATGTFSMTLLSDRLCSYLVVADAGGGVVAAHVHEGRVDANGPIAIGLDTGRPRTALTIGGCVDATTDQLDAIRDGADGFYANVHSADFPAGAVRGQLGPTLAGPANGYAETDGAGTFQQGDLGAYVDVQHYVGSDDGGNTLLCTELVGFGSPADATLDAGHVHTGDVDANGPVLIDLGVGGEEVAGSLTCVDADTADVAAVAAAPERHYVNLHTATYPAGAYRSQLAPSTSTTLTGAQEIAPDDDEDRSSVDDLVGQAVFGGFANAAGDTLCWTLLVSSLTSDDADLPFPSGFHVHDGDVGANGPVVLNLLAPPVAGDFGAFDTDLGLGAGCISQDADADVAAVLADLDGHYVNLHTDLADPSDAYLNGAVRGQLR